MASILDHTAWNARGAIVIQPPNPILIALDAKRAVADVSLFRRIVEMARLEQAMRILERTWKRR